MIFDDLLSGASLFVDANPLVYYFAPDPLFGGACARLIARIQQTERSGAAKAGECFAWRLGTHRSP